MVNKVPKERIGLAEIIQILQSRMKKNIIKNATNFASKIANLRPTMIS